MRLTWVVFLVFLLGGCAVRQTVSDPPDPVHQSLQLRQRQVYQVLLTQSNITNTSLAVNWTTDLPLELPSFWRKAAPTLMESLNKAQASQMYLPQDFPLTVVKSEDVPYIRTELREDWDKFSQAHPGITGVVEFTQVGFPKDGREAVVGYRIYHDFRRKDYREDLSWLWMRLSESSENAEWRIVHRVNTGRTVNWDVRVSPTVTPSPRE